MSLMLIHQMNLGVSGQMVLQGINFCWKEVLLLKKRHYTPSGPNVCSKVGVRQNKV